MRKWSQIALARAMLAVGVVLLAAALTALALQGSRDWALPLAPLALTVNGLIWNLRVRKYGSIFPSPKPAPGE